MRKCAFCGTDNTDGEIFCGLCGQRLDTIPNEQKDDKTAEVIEKKRRRMLTGNDTCSKGHILSALLRVW